jgi:mannose-6-phosphate isomerase-like protein (cupin superfamily)
MILFSLPPGGLSKAVAHRTVEETWYVVAGKGRLWRKRNGAEVTALAPSVSLTIPVNEEFQFRKDGEAMLQIVAVTMAPWPGESEAFPAEGVWPSTF